jgi:hypothetical protein
MSRWVVEVVVCGGGGVWTASGRKGGKWKKGWARMGQARVEVEEVVGFKGYK